MAKSKSVFLCENCGHESLKWAGKCPACGEWNTFCEMKTVPPGTRDAKSQSSMRPVALSEIEATETDRLATGIGELDRVLGGGLVPASVVLISGDPGIGKSTLLLQAAAALTEHNVPVLYVSGEESLQQIRRRALRLNLAGSPVRMLPETELENILEQVEREKPLVVVVDSIQSVYSSEINGAPGHPGQLRECTARLFRAAKERNFSLFLVGHITKDGSIAGPKIVEHTVDTVIYFEGDTLGQYRILRSLKNRFGATHEIGLFRMESDGLNEIDNPSALFLSDSSNPQVGTSVVCSFEGSRPILAEVQALVTRASYGVPQRTVSGFDQRRLALILAILEKHCGVNFGVFDVFVKVAGGLRVDDPAVDFGIAAAIYSSAEERLLPGGSIFIGEIGLNGDVRPAAQLGRRVHEAKKMGFRNIYIPAGSENAAINEVDLHKIKNLPHFAEQWKKTGT